MITEETMIPGRSLDRLGQSRKPYALEGAGASCTITTNHHKEYSQ